MKDLVPWIRNVINCLRISFGDNEFDQLNVQTPTEDKIYWMIWTITFIMACLIFLNFIIAEVCNSYQTAKDNIDSYVYKERASMVKEVEQFLPEYMKNERKDWFPQYIIIREAEK